MQLKRVWGGRWLGGEADGVDEEEQRYYWEAEQRRQDPERQRQRQEELRRQEEERQRQLEQERQRQLEEERQRQLEEERQRQLEQERQRQLEQERQRQLEQERQRQLEQERQRQLEQERQRQLEQERQRQEEERLQKEEHERQKQVVLQEQREKERRQIVSPENENQQLRQVASENERGSLLQHSGIRPSYGTVSVNRRREDSESEDEQEDVRDQRGEHDNHPLHQPLLQPQQEEPGVLDSRLANFISINSPGTQTGVVGGASGVNSLLSPPSQLPGSSRIPPKMGTATTGIGAGLNVLGMGSDLVASAQGINNMRREGGIRGFFRGLRDTFSFRRGETGKQAETRSTAKRLAVDLPVNLADASSQGMQGANAISSLVHGGTSALSPVLGVASAGIGAGVQGIVAGRAAWRMGRAWHHKRAVDRVRRDFARRDDVHQDVSDAANHMSKQLGKRRARNIIGGLGAAAGAAGGGLLLAGLLGGAAMLTPIGWALAGAGALTAAGLGAYKLYRHFKKKRERRLGTERQTHADNLHAAYQRGGQDRADAMRVLGSHGITHDHMRGDPEKSKQMIRRKLEGW